MRLFKILSWGFLFLIVFSPFMSVKALAGYETNQYYSVIYDKEQEAAVVAKLTYVNTGKDEIKNLKLEIPGSTVRIINAVQEQYSVQSYCKRYDSDASTHENTTRKCLEYGEEKLSVGSYVLLDSSNLVTHATVTRGNEITTSVDSNTLTLELKQAIASQQSGTIILSYKTKGLANPVWNGYKYSFETVKSPYDIDNVRVAINVADELYIKESAKSQTNYIDDMPRASMMLSNSEFKENSTMSKISSSIQESSGVIKDTKSLDPNENFKVEGKYYNNSWMGELPTIAGVGITFLIIVIVLLLIIKSEKKKV